MTEELVKQQEQLPAHLRDVAGREGLESVTKEDLILPRLVICQGLTPQRQRSKPSFIQGLEDGNIFNTVTQQIFGNVVEGIPVLFSRSRILFRDLKEGGGIMCRSFNGVDGGTICATCAACPNSQFSGDKSPACNLFYNFPFLLLPSLELVALSFKSTALKPARSWLTRMELLKKPMFSSVYEIKSVEQSNTKGTFYAPVFARKRWTTEDEYKTANAAYLNMRGRTIQTDEEVDGQEEHVPF